MGSVVQAQSRPSHRSALIWFLPIQGAAVFTVIAITTGGQMLRTLILGGLDWVMALPLFVSLEAGLVAMMLFEPLRGLIQLTQYLFVSYANHHPIHDLITIVNLVALVLMFSARR